MPRPFLPTPVFIEWVSHLSLFLLPLPLFPTHFSPGLLFSIQPPFFWVLLEHCSPCNLSKTYLQVCNSPIQKLFNSFLLENPTSQIQHNFVIAPAHALISSTYLTHHPTKSNCTFCSSKYILHFPTSMPHPVMLFA